MKPQLSVNQPNGDWASQSLKPKDMTLAPQKSWARVGEFAISAFVKVVHPGEAADETAPFLAVAGYDVNWGAGGQMGPAGKTSRAADGTIVSCRSWEGRHRSWLRNQHGRMHRNQRVVVQTEMARRVQGSNDGGHVIFWQFNEDRQSKTSCYRSEHVCAAVDTPKRDIMSVPVNPGNSISHGSVISPIPPRPCSTADYVTWTDIMVTASSVDIVSIDDGKDVSTFSILKAYGLHARF
nr:hypothetical protein CFP56_36457 [Quercus suber]